MPADPRRAKAIFLEALDRPSLAERTAFLDQACAGDEELRRRVEVLLKGHDTPCLLDRPAGEQFPDLATPLQSSVPDDLSEDLEEPRTNPTLRRAWPGEPHLTDTPRDPF